MKLITAILLIVQSVYSQKSHNEIFTFENSEIKYSFYRANDKGIIPVNTFFVFINYKKNIKKCLTNKYIRPYFLDMPQDISKEKQDELFLEFVSEITSRAKLLESKFYIVADKDYTKSYKEILQKEHRYKGYYMNEINDMYINLPESEICKMLQKE